MGESWRWGSTMTFSSCHMNVIWMLFRIKFGQHCVMPGLTWHSLWYLNTRTLLFYECMYICNVGWVQMIILPIWLGEWGQASRMLPMSALFSNCHEERQSQISLPCCSVHINDSWIRYVWQDYMSAKRWNNRMQSEIILTKNLAGWVNILFCTL